MYTISFYSPADKCQGNGAFHGEVLAQAPSLGKATDIANAFKLAFGTWTQLSMLGIDLVSYYTDEDGNWHEDWHVSYDAWQAMSALATPDGSAYIVQFEVWRANDVTGAVQTKHGDLRVHNGEFLFVDSKTSEHLTLNTLLAYGWEC